MKTVELPGIKIDDVGSVWRDLLKNDFDVEAVGVNGTGTYVYLADDEEKDPLPIVETWVGKEPADLSRAAVLKLRKEIMELVDDARKRRAERAAARAEEEEAKKEEIVKPEEIGVPSNTLELGGKPVSFEDAEGNVIGELMEGDPSAGPKENWFKTIWKKLF